MSSARNLVGSTSLGVYARITAYPEVESLARCRAFNFRIADDTLRRRSLTGSVLAKRLCRVDAHNSRARDGTCDCGDRQQKDGATRERG